MTGWQGPHRMVTEGRDLRHWDREPLCQWAPNTDTEGMKEGAVRARGRGFGAHAPGVKQKPESALGVGGDTSRAGGHLAARRMNPGFCAGRRERGKRPCCHRHVLILRRGNLRATLKRQRQPRECRVGSASASALASVSGVVLRAPPKRRCARPGCGAVTHPPSEA